MKNFSKIITIRLLTIVERLNEFKTGKRCIAKANFAWNVGIGYHRRIEDSAVVEFFLIPFVILSITNFSLGYTVPSAATNNSNEQ